MPTFQHPVATVKLEGTYIVKNTRLNQYVYLSEYFQGSSDQVMYDHRDILNQLSGYGITPDEELSFTPIDDTYSSTFLDA